VGDSPQYVLLHFCIAIDCGTIYCYTPGVVAHLAAITFQPLAAITSKFQWS